MLYRGPFALLWRPPGLYNTLLLPPCLAQELCDAGTLQQAVVQGHFGGSKDTSAERAKCRALLKTAREVASGMQHLHSLGIIRECSLEGRRGSCYGLGTNTGKRC